MKFAADLMERTLIHSPDTSPSNFFSFFKFVFECKFSNFPQMNSNSSEKIEFVVMEGLLKKREKVWEKNGKWFSCIMKD